MKFKKRKPRVSITTNKQIKISITNMEAQDVTLVERLYHSQVGQYWEMLFIFGSALAVTLGFTASVEIIKYFIYITKL